MTGALHLYTTVIEVSDETKSHFSFSFEKKVTIKKSFVPGSAPVSSRSYSNATMLEVVEKIEGDLNIFF